MIEIKDVSFEYEKNKEHSRISTSRLSRANVFFSVAKADAARPRLQN